MSDRKLYVGNLSFGVEDNQLRDMFEKHGVVDSARVIKDRDTGRSKGFGFVEMATPEAAQAAINALNGMEVSARKLTVNLARPREEGGNSRGGSGGGGGGYGGGSRDRGPRNYGGRQSEKIYLIYNEPYK